jgi:hypothetical protein
MKNYCDLSSPPFMEVNFKIQDLIPTALVLARGWWMFAGKGW